MLRQDRLSIVIFYHHDGYILKMNLWDLYERQSDLGRITITFNITVLLIIAIIRIDKWAKTKIWVKPGKANNRTESKPFLYNNLERKPDGTLVAYISYWRYLIFGLLFVVGFWISYNGLVSFYQELPKGFWKNWDKVTTITFVLLIIVLAMPVMLFRFLKSNFKKVQLEINIDQVRYLKSAVKGGTLLSDQYQTVPYNQIVEVGFRQNPLGSGIIDLITSHQTHVVLLLLPVDQQFICYRSLQEAVKEWKENRITSRY